MKKYRFYCGIDTGVQTGFALWDSQEKCFLQIETMAIHRAMDKVRRLRENHFDTFIRVEDARLRRWIPRMPTESREKGRNQGAGSIKRDAKIWEDFLTDLEIPFEMVAPKNNKTKVNAETFKKLTKWQGKTSSHSRDAGMLCFGL